MGWVFGFGGIALLAIVAFIVMQRRNRRMRDEMGRHDDDSGVIGDLHRGDAAYDSEAWRGDQHWPDDEDDAIR